MNLTDACQGIQVGWPGAFGFAAGMFALALIVWAMAWSAKR